MKKEMETTVALEKDMSNLKEEHYKEIKNLKREVSENLTYVKNCIANLHHTVLLKILKACIYLLHFIYNT